MEKDKTLEFSIMKKGKSIIKDFSKTIRTMVGGLLQTMKENGFKELNAVMEFSKVHLLMLKPKT